MERPTCPDGGTCHHGCAHAGECWRVAYAAPLSPHRDWRDAQLDRVERACAWLRDLDSLRNAEGMDLQDELGLIDEHLLVTLRVLYPGEYGIEDDCTCAN